MNDEFNMEVTSGNEGKGKSIASVVLGIVSLIVCLSPLSIICGIIAVILGKKAMNETYKEKGKAGFILGIVGSILSLATLIIALIFAFGMGGIMAPQLIKYTEMSNQANDRILLDMAQDAILVSLLDPSIISDTESADEIASFEGQKTDLAEVLNGYTKFDISVQEILGVYSDYEFMLKLQDSDNKNKVIMFEIEDNQVTVEFYDVY